MSSQILISDNVAVGHFSSLLKHWRNVRRLTQIELAGEANVSARHLCFLETGRAQPSREMVQLLGNALDLPLDERNALHAAAGFMPPYGDWDWRPTICSTFAGRWISFFDNRSLIPELSLMDVGTSAFAIKRPVVCSSIFGTLTKWNPALRTMRCTSFSIQKACDSSS